jgi:hypothetical protein
MMIAPLLAQFQEECRDMRRLNLIDDLGRDLRYAGRTLRREPAFTLVVIATLALGIGASTAIFSVCNAVLLKRLPYPQPERLVMIWEQGRNSPSSRVSAANFVDWRDQSHSFSQMAAINPSVDYVLTGRGEPQRLAGAAVSADFFPLLGVHMETMQQVVSASVGAPRFRTTLVGAFALMALIIASIGIYGVISYSVRQRTREFGVRLAMGATASEVLSLVLLCFANIRSARKKLMCNRMHTCHRALVPDSIRSIAPQRSRSCCDREYCVATATCGIPAKV